MTTRPAGVAGLAAILVGLGLLTGGCADGGTGVGSEGQPSTSASGPMSESPSASETASETATSSPTAAASPVIENGRNFAFVKSIDTSAEPPTIRYDLAYFLTGDEATRAAKEHGDEVPPPNDYYIVNDSPRLRTVPLSPTVDLVFLDWSQCCDETFHASLDAFAQALEQGETTFEGHLYKGRLSPYWLVAKDGQVVRIEEKFLP